jgi:hypothetical protein
VNSRPTARLPTMINKHPLSFQVVAAIERRLEFQYELFPSRYR